MNGWELLSEMHEEEGRCARAQDSIDEVREEIRAKPIQERRYPSLARAGRCLVQIERELPKAKEHARKKRCSFRLP